MQDYYLAKSLKQLRDEINDAHPGRDKASDGWIGDPSHSARVSDHNPDYADGGVVRALDIDISDIDVSALMAVLKADNRTNYYIFERSIYGASKFARRAYKGVNPHTQHLHVSIKHTKAAEAGRAWGYGGKIKPNASKPKPVHSSQPTDYKNLATDGIFGKKSVEALQIVMRATGDYPGIVDGKAGPLTWKAVQSWLKGHGLYKRAIDGKPGRYTIDALQQFLRKKGLYPASKWRVDGDFGPATVEAFQRYLNTQNGQ
ncbi:peptidoglycan-binding domain-containing protein [Glutamicibacter arilaitensis]|uniref:peptidoglycan-binding domain-containing protein n=1 Tax=Glutamicibacter arilaitensis TaxID=256701 RepID=UPI003FD2C99F